MHMQTVNSTAKYCPRQARPVSRSASWATRRFDGVRVRVATPTSQQPVDEPQSVPTDSVADVPLELDKALAVELEENGPRSTRRTKIVCTIGPATCSREQLEMLAAGGMNVARLNMCHGEHTWHAEVIRTIREINDEKGYSVAVMVDTEGSEVHTSALSTPIKAEVNDDVWFTVRPISGDDSGGEARRMLGVSYEGFVDDIRVGDMIVVDGGMVSLEVVEKAGPDVRARCVDPGLILSRANLTFRRGADILRGRNAMLPVITAKDWLDIDFAIAQKVDFIAVSFVKTADVIKNLRSYIAMRAPDHPIEIMAKVESCDSIPNISEIVDAADSVMVARADLGAQIPPEDVPSVQKEIVFRCRQKGKPVMVASQLMNSMIEFPIPTRAEVADVADVVRQQADAVMLSAETAIGKYPQKVIEAVRNVCLRAEDWCRQEKFGQIMLPELATTPDGRMSEELCASAAMMADKLKARAIFVYTRRGFMANFISRCRPDCPVFAFTDSVEVRRRMNLRWGVLPFLTSFENDPEINVERTFKLLKRRELVQPGDLVVVVSDIRPKNKIIRSIQLRYVV